jgi:hypothetical protein
MKTLNLISKVLTKHAERISKCTQLRQWIDSEAEEQRHIERMIRRSLRVSRQHTYRQPHTIRPQIEQLCIFPSSSSFQMTLWPQAKDQRTFVQKDSQSSHRCLEDGLNCSRLSLIEPLTLGVMAWRATRARYSLYSWFLCLIFRACVTIHFSLHYHCMMLKLDSCTVM